MLLFALRNVMELGITATKRDTAKYFLKIFIVVCNVTLALQLYGKYLLVISGIMLNFVKRVNF